MIKKGTILFMLLALFWGNVAAVDTLYVHQTDTIVIRETRYKKVPVTVEKEVKTVVEVPGAGDCEDKVFYVYFPSGRYTLDDAAQKAVHEMAKRLEENPEMGVRLTGYCDYVGSSDLNNRLSLARANVVGNRLKQAYGIDSRRVKVEGKGMLTNVKADYSPNRRVEMRLENIEPLAIKSQASRVERQESRVESQESRVESQGAKVITTVEVAPHTTLAQLARKYYGNPSCWVYLYAMNKTVIRDPNTLKVGQQIRIPELSEVDKQITKQEAEEYYRMIRK